MKKFISLISSILVGFNCITISVCSASEVQKISIDGADYAYTDTGSDITINSIDTSNSSLIIPSVINNKTVTKLSDKVCAYNENIRTVELPSSIKEIGDEAFVECTNLKTINIPDGITSLGRLTFSMCNSLVEITLPDSIQNIGSYCFAYCSALQKASIPIYLTELSDGIFADCLKLTSISIPDSVNKIGVAAFSGCSSLSNIDWDLNADSISANAFDDTPWLENNPAEFLMLNNETLLFAYNGTEKNVVIPSTVKEISDSVFSNHTEIESVKIPDGITGISSLMFSGCSSLKSVDMPESLEYIGMGGFGECKSLKDIYIPDGVTNIKEKAFYMCESLESVHLPSNLEILGRLAFGKCTSLKTINIPKGICASIEHTVFNETNLENVTIEGNMTTQLSEALKNGNWTDGEKEFVINDGILTSYSGSGGNVVIPDEVTEIGANVFSGKKITNITLPQYLTKIGKRAFYGISSLNDISFPGSVTEIGSMAFAECTNLKYIIFEEGSGSVSLGDSSFQSTAVTEDGLITNGRTILNKEAAFTNTALESDNKPTATEAPVPIETESAQSVLNVSSGKDGISINSNGKKMDFDDAQPFIDENDRTQIPIRAVAEAMGCTVDWDEKTQTATISKDKKIIVIQIGNTNMQVDKSIVTMDTTAQIINDRTYIPVRFVGEALGMEVSWQSEII